MNAEVIGEKIKNLREKNNISRENFANAVEISQSALSMYENGQRIPRDEVKLRIARFFNTSIEELFLQIKYTKCEPNVYLTIQYSKSAVQ